MDINVGANNVTREQKHLYKNENRARKHLHRNTENLKMSRRAKIHKMKEKIFYLS